MRTSFLKVFGWIGMLIILTGLISVPWAVLAAPPQKEICPAPKSQSARKAAVKAACRHFGQVPKSWGLHSAFAPSGKVIDCIHFKCGPAAAAAPRPSSAVGMAPKRFMLRFSDAYLVYQVKSKNLQITAQNMVLSYGRDWQVKQLKPYLFHLRQKVWKGFFWKVNTSRKQVYRAKGGTFGRLGGTESVLNIRVDPVGGDNNPKRLMLRFSDGSLVYQPKAKSLQTSAHTTVLSYGGDWQSSQLKSYLYHLRQKVWKGFYWKVNTSRKQVYRVEGGKFGSLGGREKVLDITVDVVP